MLDLHEELAILSKSYQSNSLCVFDVFAEQHAAGFTVLGGKVRQPAAAAATGPSLARGRWVTAGCRIFITSGPKLSERYSAAAGGEGRDGSSGGVPVLLPQHSV